MRPHTNDVALGQTGDTVPHSGRYAAVGCCRRTKDLSQGALFPACPAHGKSTAWEWVPPGAVVETTAPSLATSGAYRALRDDVAAGCEAHRGLRRRVAISSRRAL
jgi:hypothetical protein